MLTRNKKLKDYGIPSEDIEKLNTMLKDFPAEYGYLLSILRRLCQSRNDGGISAHTVKGLFDG